MAIGVGRVGWGGVGVVVAVTRLRWGEGLRFALRLSVVMDRLWINPTTLKTTELLQDLLPEGRWEAVSTYSKDAQKETPCRAGLRTDALKMIQNKSDNVDRSSLGVRHRSLGTGHGPTLTRVLSRLANVLPKQAKCSPNLVEVGRPAAENYSRNPPGGTLRAIPRVCPGWFSRGRRGGEKLFEFEYLVVAPPAPSLGGRVNRCLCAGFRDAARTTQAALRKFRAEPRSVYSSPRVATKCRGRRASWSTPTAPSTTCTAATRTSLGRVAATSAPARRERRIADGPNSAAEIWVCSKEMCTEAGPRGGAG